MLKELLSINNFPNLIEYNTQSFKEKAITLFKTYGYVFLFLLAIAPVLAVTEYFVTHVLHFKSLQTQNSTTFQQFFEKVKHLKALLYICLVGPIMEEIVFRLPLSLKRQHIAFTIAFISFWCVSLLPMVKQLNLSYSIPIKIALVAAVYLISIKLIPQNVQSSTRLKNKVIIISICAFGLLHITNYIPIQWSIIWLYPIYVLPQLGMGWALTYLRFKNGFLWGIALHCLINSVSTALAAHHIEKSIKSPTTVIKSTNA